MSRNAVSCVTAGQRVTSPLGQPRLSSSYVSERFLNFQLFRSRIKKVITIHKHFVHKSDDRYTTFLHFYQYQISAATLHAQSLMLTM